jgi:hypothetical protein
VFVEPPVGSPSVAEPALEVADVIDPEIERSNGRSGYNSPDKFLKECRMLRVAGLAKADEPSSFPALAVGAIDRPGSVQHLVADSVHPL